MGQLLAFARVQGGLFLTPYDMRIMRKGGLFGLRFFLDFEIFKENKVERFVKRGKSAFIR